MNPNASPQPGNIGAIARDNVNYGKYFQARDILSAMQAELSTYLTIDDKPAEETVQEIRDRLTAVIESLDLLLEDGISSGLSDREYLRALMDLRAIAINSKQAETEGAYMRTYQYSHDDDRALDDAVLVGVC